MPTGIHHVTAITRHVQANVDFYAGFLGLALVKRTGSFEDGGQLRLFYGDGLGTPGSIISFVIWEDGAPGRVGHGQVAEIALAVPPASIGAWLTRAMSARVPVEGPLHEMGETVLRLKDPDGIIIKLVGADMPARDPLPDMPLPDAPQHGLIAPTRLRGVTLFTATPDATRDFIAGFGYVAGAVTGTVQRMHSGTDIVDVRDATGFFEGIPGTGIIDHVAFRAADTDAVTQLHAEIVGDDLTPVADHTYFTSFTLRDPGGILVEYATDTPGFCVDEDASALGQTLFIPPAGRARGDDLRVILPQFALPGEARMPIRDLHFVHRFHHPAAPDGSTVILLHDTGGSEADLMPLGAHIAPGAALLGVRGRSTEEGIRRWFRRTDAVTFDQADIRAEAEAFVAFIDQAVRAYGLDRARITFLGHANGAALIGAILQLAPHAIGRAIILRGVQVLTDAAPLGADALAGHRVLMLNGKRDMFGRMTPALEAALRQGGADLTVQTLPAGQELSPADTVAAREWLAQNEPAGH